MHKTCSASELQAMHLTSSNSSEAMEATRFVLTKASMTTSLLNTSSFFCGSSVVPPGPASRPAPPG